jgi:hypothetical protein
MTSLLSPNRVELERKLGEIDPSLQMQAQASSAMTVWELAVEHELATPEQRDEAERRYGRRWNYCGD